MFKDLFGCGSEQAFCYTPKALASYRELEAIWLFLQIRHPLCAPYMGSTLEPLFWKYSRSYEGTRLKGRIGGNSPKQLESDRQARRGSRNFLSLEGLGSI